MQEIVSSSPFSANALVKILTVFVIPLDKELAVNCLLETHTKLGGLILAATVFMRDD